MASQVTIDSLRKKKQSGKKITAVTAYDATMATLLDAADVDVLMVGDSLGMVVQGNETTLSVTLDDMIYHCRAVVRAKPKAHVVCDLPFLSYQVSDEAALLAAGRLLKEGAAQSVKMEGGLSLAPRVAKIVSAGIPVMGHVGLTPQSVHQMSGFRVQGRTREAAKQLVEDAQALDDAGVYAIVIEGVPSEVASLLTKSVSVPTIGIGAGPHTDGQVLVCYDLLGMYRGLSPKFVKKFADLGEQVIKAASAYKAEVEAGAFPAAEHSFSMQQGQDVPTVRYGEDTVQRDDTVQRGVDTVQRGVETVQRGGQKE